jgi:hypothetical protein
MEIRELFEAMRCFRHHSEEGEKKVRVSVAGLKAKIVLNSHDRDHRLSNFFPRVLLMKRGDKFFLTEELWFEVVELGSAKERRS